MLALSNPKVFEKSPRMSDENDSINTLEIEENPAENDTMDTIENNEQNDTTNTIENEEDPEFYPDLNQAAEGIFETCC